MVTGFAAGYYLGARAGRQRYDQINRTLSRLKRSEAFETATDRAKAVVEEQVDKARSLIESRTGNGHGGSPDWGQVDATAVIIPGPTDPPAGDYSSSR